MFPEVGVRTQWIIICEGLLLLNPQGDVAVHAVSVHEKLRFYAEGVTRPAASRVLSPHSIDCMIQRAYHTESCLIPRIVLAHC